MSLHHVHYYSEAIGKAMAANVIHPDSSVPRPYHCLILLHGLSDDYSIWQRRTSIERYVDGKPLIVVMPDGARSFYVDGLQGYDYLQSLAYELPALLQHWFKIEGRWATAGLSMGGYGALRVALEHPGLFRAAVSHSGALMLGNTSPVKGAPQDRDKEFLSIMGEGKPGGPNDLIALAKKSDPRPAIRIDCGTEDFLLPMNREFHRQFVELGIKHEYEEFHGTHNWEYWDLHVRDSIKFVLQAMQEEELDQP